MLLFLTFILHTQYRYWGTSQLLIIILESPKVPFVNIYLFQQINGLPALRRISGLLVCLVWNKNLKIVNILQHMPHKLTFIFLILQHNMPNQVSPESTVRFIKCKSSIDATLFICIIHTSVTTSCTVRSLNSDGNQFSLSQNRELKRKCCTLIGH